MAWSVHLAQCIVSRVFLLTETTPLSGRPPRLADAYAFTRGSSRSAFSRSIARRSPALNP